MSCDVCPHPNECGRCLYDIGADDIAQYQSCRLMLPMQARNVMKALQEGITPRQFVKGRPPYGLAVVSMGKLKKHCAVFPEFGAEVNRLAAINVAAAHKRKGEARRNQTHCKRGHSLAAAKIYGRGHYRFRRCLVCQKAADKLGRPVKPAVIKKVKAALIEGQTMGFITSGGSPGYLVKHRDLLRYRNENPEFGKFVANAIAGNNKRAQIQRAQHHKFITGTPAVQNAFYREILDLVPKYLPEDKRDDVVIDIFKAVLEGRLRYADVRQRVGQFVAAHDRLFPTKYAMRSLDVPAYREGAIALIETISEDQGLWR